MKKEKSMDMILFTMRSIAVLQITLQITIKIECLTKLDQNGDPS